MLAAADSGPPPLCVWAAEIVAFSPDVRCDLPHWRRKTAATISES
jgi:hypothetical protein